MKAFDYSERQRLFAPKLTAMLGCTCAGLAVSAEPYGYFHPLRCSRLFIQRFRAA
jgi:hypothetical protein